MTKNCDRSDRRFVSVLPLAILLVLAGVYCACTSRSQAADKANSAKGKTVREWDWPQFLGPHRNGISEETGLFKKWPENGPKQIWRVDGGAGMSGLAIQNGRLVTLVQRDGRQRVLVLNSITGEPVHDVPIAPEFINGMGNGPRATPAIADDAAYAYTGEGILAAVNLKTGKTLWTHDVVKELDGEQAGYGMAGSPLVVGDLVIVVAGAPKGTLAAYERETGKVAWQAVASGGEDTAGYSSPALLKVGGTEQIVAFEGKAAIGIHPKTGKVLWRFPYITDFDCNIATPVAVEGNVFISSGENHGCALLSLEPDGDLFSVKPIWESHGPRSVMRNEWQTSILLDGYLYGMDNVGGAGPVTHLNCVEAATGKRVWQELRFGKGNITAADGKLFISTIKGELVVVRATPEKFAEIGRTQVLGSTRQAPVIVNGRLYLRDDREIVCLYVRDPK